MSKIQIFFFILNFITLFIMQRSAHINFLLYFNYCFIIIKIFYFVCAHVYVHYLHIHHV